MERKRKEQNGAKEGVGRPVTWKESSSLLPTRRERCVQHRHGRCSTSLNRCIGHNSLNPHVTERQINRKDVDVVEAVVIVSRHLAFA